MSTSLLYHAFGVRGYDYVRTQYLGGEVIFTMRPVHDHLYEQTRAMEEPLTDPQADESPLRVAALFSHPVQYLRAADAGSGCPARRRPDRLLLQPAGTRREPRPRVRRLLPVGRPPARGLSLGLPAQHAQRENGVHGFFRLINPSVIGELWRQSFDAILVHGYEHCTKWLAFWGARLAGTGIILRGESHLLDERPWYIHAAKRLVLGTLMRMTSACTYIGEANRAFYRHYGTPEERLFFAPYVVDNDAFQAQHERLRPRRDKSAPPSGSRRRHRSCSPAAN